MQKYTYTGTLAGVCAAAACALALAIPSVSSAAHITVGGAGPLVSVKVSGAKVTALSGATNSGTGADPLLNVQLGTSKVAATTSTAATGAVTSGNGANGLLNVQLGANGAASAAPLVNVGLGHAGTTAASRGALLNVKLGTGATAASSTSSADSTVTLHDDFFVNSGSPGN